MLPAWCKGHCQQSPCKKLPKENLCWIFRPCSFLLSPALWVPSKWLMSSPKQITFAPVFPCARENQYYPCATILFSCRLGAAAVGRYCSYYFLSGLGNFSSLQYVFIETKNKFCYVQNSIGCSKAFLKGHIITFFLIAVTAPLSPQLIQCTWTYGAILEQHL